MQNLFATAIDLYQEMLTACIAKESDQFILPEATPAQIYMSAISILGAIILNYVQHMELKKT